MERVATLSRTMSQRQAAPAKNPNGSARQDLKTAPPPPASSPPQSSGTASPPQQPNSSAPAAVGTADSAAPTNLSGVVEKLSLDLPLTNVYPPRFFRMLPVERQGEDLGDYIDAVMKATGKKVLRFKEMPVAVYITPFGNAAYMRSCIKGFESWEQRTAGKIRFVQVGSPDQARIRVIWNNLGMSTDGDNCALGAHTVTKWKKKGSGKLALFSVGAVPVPIYIPSLGAKYKVPPQVIEINVDLINSKSDSIRYILLQNIVTHELGHALGLLGHSPDQSDIMYKVTDEHSRISQRDISTLDKLYLMKIDIPL